MYIALIHWEDVVGIMAYGPYETEQEARREGEKFLEVMEAHGIEVVKLNEEPQEPMEFYPKGGKS